MGLWRSESARERHPGCFYVEDDKAYLKIFFEWDDRSRKPLSERDPQIEPFLFPNRPTILGETRTAGRVTLLECAERDWNTKFRADGTKEYAELTLLVTHAWAGADFISPIAHYNSLSFAAPGLHNILSATRVDTKRLRPSTGERKSDTPDLHALTGADQAFLVFNRPPTDIELESGGKVWKIVFSTETMETMSATVGHGIHTRNFISVETGGATIEELRAVAYEIEQFISLLCVGPFRGEEMRIEIDPVSATELIWTWRTNSFARPLERRPEDTLVNLGEDPESAAAALRTWFGANEARKMARWLIFDSLFKETSSTAKFLAVAQAWEIIGREQTDSAAYEKDAFTKACSAARVAIETHLGAEATARLVHLLRSSNQKGFADLTRGVLNNIPKLALDMICPDVDKFVSATVNARNVLTHMQARSNLSIEKASHLSLYLTHKLIVLFCIYECRELSLPLENLARMLSSNDIAWNATRPIPEY